jgi:two-component system, chemotaxis family, chemotaxis protein CheY
MPYNFRNISVLAVEPSSVMLDLTKSILKAFGVTRVYSALNFEQGHEAYLSVKPDLILVDWLDEPNTGLKLIKKIRTDPNSPNPYTPIILTTGHSVKERIYMARDCGVTSILAKPYTARTLYQRIEQVVENPRKFVRANDFFGPDRRIRNENPDGQDKRTEAPAAEIYVTADQITRNQIRLSK